MSENGHLYVWDISTQIAYLSKNLITPPSTDLKPVYKFNHGVEGYGMSWSTVKHALATGDRNGNIYLHNILPDGSAYSTVNSENPYSTQVANNWIECIEWSPCEPNVFATVDTTGHLSVWHDQKSRPMISFKAHDAEINTVSWNKHTNYLLATGDDNGVIKIWDVATAAALITMDPLPHPPVCLAFSGDGHRMAAGLKRPIAAEDGPEPNVLVWDLAKKQQLLAFSAHRELVAAVAFNVDGSILVTGGDCLDEPDSPTLSFWNVETGEPLAGARAADTSEVRALARTPDGSQVAAACWQTITFWDLASHEKKLTVNSGSWDQFRSVALSPDGRLVAGGCYEYIRVWDLTVSHTLGHLTGYNADVTSLSFCGDGAHLVGVSTPDGQWDAGLVKVWDAKTHVECATLESPTGAKVVKVAFSPRRKMILTADNEGAICMWGLMEE